MRSRPPARWTAATLALLIGLLVAVPGGRPGGAPPTPPLPPHAPAVVLLAAPARGGPAPATPATGGEVILRASNNDSGAVPSTGFETNITDFVATPLPAYAAFQANGEVVVGNCQVVLGIFENWTLDPTAFFEIFNNTTDASVRLVLWPGLLLSPGLGYGFSFVEVAGTEWRAEVDGAPFAGSLSASTVDCGTNRSTWAGAITFSEVAQFPTTPFAPPNVTAGLAFASLVGGNWRLSTGAVFSTFGRLAGPWGMAGRAQNLSLAPGQVDSGPSLPSLTNGTPLWTGGAVPVEVGLALANGSVVAGGSDAAVAWVNTTSGGPLLQVPVGLTDGGGGLFGPAIAATDAAGRVSSTFFAPNTSRPLQDTLTAKVLLPGFLGEATASLAVSGAERLRVEPLANLTVAPGGSVTVTFRVLNATGNPLRGVPLEFAAPTLLGSITLAAASTDPVGSASTTFVAGNGTGTATVTARVLGPGAWGVGAVTIRVVAPPVPWNTRLAAYLPDLVAVGIIAAVVIGVVRYARRPRPPVPTLVSIKPSSFLGPPAGATLPGPDAPGGGEAPAPGPEVTRTPPEGGTP